MTNNDLWNITHKTNKEHHGPD